MLSDAKSRGGKTEERVRLNYVAVLLMDTQKLFHSRLLMKFPSEWFRPKRQNLLMASIQLFQVSNNEHETPDTESDWDRSGRLKVSQLLREGFRHDSRTVLMMIRVMKLRKLLIEHVLEAIKSSTVSGQISLIMHPNLHRRSIERPIIVLVCLKSCWIRQSKQKFAKEISLRRINHLKRT